MGSRLENPLGMTTAFCQAEAPEQESTRAVPTLHSPRNSLPANQTPRFSLGLGFFFPLHSIWLKIGVTKSMLVLLKIGALGA